MSLSSFIMSFIVKLNDLRLFHENYVPYLILLLILLNNYHKIKILQYSQVIISELFTYFI